MSPNKLFHQWADTYQRTTELHWTQLSTRIRTLDYEWKNELIIYCKLSLHSDTLTSEHHRRFSIFQVDQMKLHSLRYNQSLALYHLLSDDTTMSITIQRQVESNQWVQFSLIFVCTDRLLRRIRRINCWKSRARQTNRPSPQRVRETLTSIRSRQDDCT